MFIDFTKEECINCIKENVPETALKDIANELGYKIGKEVITFTTASKSAQKNYVVYIMELKEETIKAKDSSKNGDARAFRCAVIGGDNPIYSQAFASYIYDKIKNIKDFKSVKSWASFKWLKTYDMTRMVSFESAINDSTIIEFDFKVIYEKAAK